MNISVLRRILKLSWTLPCIHLRGHLEHHNLYYGGPLGILIISPGTGHRRCSRWSKERHHNRLPVMKIINVDSMLIDINFFTFFVNTPECCTSVWPSAWAWRKRRTETRTSWPERRGHRSLRASPPRSRSDKGCSSSRSSLEKICIYIYIIYIDLYLHL